MTPRRRLPRVAIGGVARSVVVVGSAAAVGQGALILASPILARLYDPESFGLLSVYAALLSVLLAASSLRFDLAIPIATEDGEAIDLLLFSIVVALVSSVVAGLVVLLWGDQIASVLGVSQMAQLLWLLPIALLVASISQSIASWAVYRRTFPALGRMRAIQGLTRRPPRLCSASCGSAPPAWSSGTSSDESWVPSSCCGRSLPRCGARTRLPRAWFGMFAHTGRSRAS